MPSYTACWFFFSKIDKNLNSIDIKLNIVLIIEQNIHCKL